MSGRVPESLKDSVAQCGLSGIRLPAIRRSGALPITRSHAAYAAEYDECLFEATSVDDLAGHASKGISR